MLDTIRPRFKQMSVNNLVGSLKVVSYPHGDLTNQFGEVVGRVYAVGNQLLINEIKSRPPSELRGLCKLGSDKVMLVEGPQGSGLPLTYDLEEILNASLVSAFLQAEAPSCISAMTGAGRNHSADSTHARTFGLG